MAGTSTSALLLASAVRRSNSVSTAHAESCKNVLHELVPARRTSSRLSPWQPERGLDPRRAGIDRAEGTRGSVLLGLGGSRRRGRAATELLINIATRRYSGWKRSSASFRSFSLACEWRRIRRSSISLWPSVARAAATQRRTIPTHHHRRRTKIFRVTSPSRVPVSESASGFGAIMPITRLLQNASFGPDEIKILVRAFEEALGTLRVDRNDPISEALAKKIIELAQRGERDPIQLRQHAVRAVSHSNLSLSNAGTLID